MSAFHSLSDEWRLVIIRRDAYTVCSSLWLSELMAAGSVAAKLWDQYIRPIEDPLPPTPCLCFKLCEYLFVPSSAFACLHLCLWSVNLWVCLDIAAYLWFASLLQVEIVDTHKSKALTSPNASFPSSASSRQWLQIITALFFCPLLCCSPYSALPKCCCSSMWD